MGFMASASSSKVVQSIVMEAESNEALPVRRPVSRPGPAWKRSLSRISRMARDASASAIVWRNMRWQKRKVDAIAAVTIVAIAVAMSVSVRVNPDLECELDMSVGDTRDFGAEHLKMAGEAVVRPILHVDVQHFAAV